MTTVFCVGGGTNTGGLAVGLHERGIKIDYALFADTEGEQIHTYLFIDELSKWMVAHGMPPITIVKGDSPQMIADGGLEGECLRRKALPSIAYGFKTCSQKWKMEPQDKYLRSIGATDIVKIIGFDADEPQRAKPYPGNRYPLIEWGWGRDECIEAIDRAGLTRPGKSACFFCPSSKAHEILALPKDLQDRAIAMEKNAQLTTVKGLGRNFAWADLIRADRAQIDMFKSNIEIDCGCYDGAEA